MRILIGFIVLALWLIATGYIAKFAFDWYKKTKLHRKLAEWKHEELDYYALKYLSEDIWGFICLFSFIVVSMLVYAYSFGLIGLILMGVAYTLGL
jgi:hypothetical protein